MNAQHNHREREEGGGRREEGGVKIWGEGGADRQRVK